MGRKHLDTWPYIEEKETGSACELPGETRLEDATGRCGSTRAGLRSAERRCDPRCHRACPERGDLEEAGGPQLFRIRKVERGMG